MIEVNLITEDGKFSFEEWCEVPNFLHISYSEDGKMLAELPVIDKEQWEKFKLIGDLIFDNMEE